MSQFNIMQALLVSEIHDGLSGETRAPTPEELARLNNPTVRDAWDTLKEAKRKYQVVLKLALVTDRFK